MLNAWSSSHARLNRYDPSVGMVPRTLPGMPGWGLTSLLPARSKIATTSHPVVGLSWSLRVSRTAVAAQVLKWPSSIGGLGRHT